MKISLLGRQRCHLCDDAAAVLIALRDEFDLSVAAIDIDTDDELVKEYGLRIPVILDGDGQVVAEGIIDRTSLRRVLKGRVAGDR